jgi:hypothetical protein
MRISTRSDRLHSLFLQPLMRHPKTGIQDETAVLIPVEGDAETVGVLRLEVDRSPVTASGIATDLSLT